MESLTEMFVDILVLYKKMGFFYAWKNWNDCCDPDKMLEKSIRIEEKISKLKRRIKMIEYSLSNVLEENEMKILINECFSEFESYREIIEQGIEFRFRPSYVHFNNDALINLTKHNIPFDIKLNLSFGYKFLSPYICHTDNMYEILAQLEQCVDEAIPEAKHLEVSVELNHILSKHSPITWDDNKNWLIFVNKRTVEFFKKNKDIFATRSDKGGHTVVIDNVEYENKLRAHIAEGKYEIIGDNNPLPELIKKEKSIILSLKAKEKCKEYFKDFKVSFEDKTLQLPKFYGLPKVNKTNIPVRPITSTVGSVGYFLAKFFDMLLQIVFPRSEFHIKDSYDFIKFVNNKVINDGQVLVSFDVVGMFTNIPFDLVMDIIMKEAVTFYELFDIDKKLLHQIVVFLLKDCMFFQAINDVFRQTDGLPMGSCISPTVARIVMDKVIINLIEEVPQISFVKIFVDDTIAAIDKGFVDKALNVLNDFRKGQLKFTIEKENDNKSINFLNVTLTRENNIIITNWFKKNFASGRLLNFFSSHKRTTIINTATHFILTVLMLSDPGFFHINKVKIFETLRQNCFPETLINVLLNYYYTYMRPFNSKPFDYLLRNDTEESDVENEEENLLLSSQNEEYKNKYIIFPHSICKGRDVKRVICNYKRKSATLADSVRNTKLNSVTTRKTVTPMHLRKNLILNSRCCCKKVYRISKTNFNENGDIASRKMLTLNKYKCDEFGHAFHKIKYHKGLFYASQTSYLLSYVQWIYRHKLDRMHCRYNFPMMNFGKLINCSCCVKKNRNRFKP